MRSGHRFIATLLRPFKMFFTVILVIVVIIILHYSMHGTRKGRLLNKLPGPSKVPVLGNLLDFFCSSEELYNKTRHFSNLYKNKYIVWALNIPFVNITEPEDFEIILSSYKYIDKSSMYDFIHPWLKQGLLTSTGEKWAKRRKILTPTLHFNILQQFCAIFDEECKKLIDKLQTEVGNEETDILPYVFNFTLHSICETAMGVKLDLMDENEGTAYRSAIEKIAKVITYRFKSIFYHFNFIYAMSKCSKIQNAMLKVLHNFTKKVIQQRRILRNSSNLTLDGIEGTKSKKRLAMLDLLLESESNGAIDEDGIKEEVDTFMFEGHDTVTSVITTCLLLIANHPDIQKRAAEEVMEVYKKSDDIITLQMLNEMPYLENCIKESLRLYPSVGIIGRLAKEDIPLKDYLIPKGSTLHLHIVDLHRREEIYPDPMKFDPDRFTKENCAKRHPFAYLPFSAGPRNCIGQKFAMLELKAVISSILKNFEMVAVTKTENIRVHIEFVIRTIEPPKIKFISRN